MESAFFFTLLLAVFGQNDATLQQQFPSRFVPVSFVQLGRGLAPVNKWSLLLCIYVDNMLIDIYLVCASTWYNTFVVFVNPVVYVCTKFIENPRPSV